MEENKDYSKINYRFSYVISVNNANDNTDITLVKRDFDINSFDEKSLYSLNLKECVDDIVRLVDKDLKSKSRTYTWYNFDTNYITNEFVERIPVDEKTVFKFTFYDKDKVIITKIWNGDGYPCSIRSLVDLTNRKYKTNGEQLDFVRQILKKASSDKDDLTYIIMKHLMTVCSSYYSKEHNKSGIFKQFLPELLLEEAKYVSYTPNKLSDVLNGEVNNNNMTFCYVGSKIKHSEIINDDRGGKLYYENYTTQYQCGKNYNKSLELSPFDKWLDDINSKRLRKTLSTR